MIFQVVVSRQEESEQKKEEAESEKNSLLVLPL